VIEAQFSLKPGYLTSPRISWSFGRTAAKQLRLLKDGEGRYLFEPSIQAGMPGTLLCIPMQISEYCPSTFTSSSYVGILGDWKYYAVCYALEAKFEVLRELFALSNQVAVTCRTEVDSMPTVSEAFARVKLP
jgi:HK97 family phage major capsid protein